MITFSVAFRVVHVVLPSLYRRGFYADFYELIFEMQEVISESDLENIGWSDEFIFELQELLHGGFFDEIDQLSESIFEFQSGLSGSLSERGFNEMSRSDEFFFELQELLHGGFFDEIDQLSEFIHDFQRSLTGRLSASAFDEIGQLVWRYAMENNANVTVWEILPDGSQGERLHHFNFAPIDMSFDSELATGRFHSVSGRSEFMITVDASLLPLNQTMAIIDSLYLPVLTAVFFLSAVISYFYSRYLAKPIVELNATSKRLGELDLGGHIKMERTDEIGELSETLNEMAIKLKNSLFDLQDANVKLQEEMEREREQEKRRRDLFTSISHELKTPITILKGEIGGMIDGVGVYKDRDVYLRSAHGWTETLEKLVSEVLTISRLEGERMKLDFQKVDLFELVQSVGQDHQELAIMKGISLFYEGDLGLVAKVDVSGMKMALSNIINNAIFHSEAGSKVHVALNRKGDVGVLAVVNKGSKISEKEIPHLFDPFYRIDKSRNRHTGGSGLGLFIVKNILELHGFEYGIANHKEGVVFTIEFPINDL